MTARVAEWRAWIFPPFPAGACAAGLRLLPGAASVLLGLQAAELVDLLAPLAQRSGVLTVDRAA